MLFKAHRKEILQFSCIKYFLLIIRDKIILITHGSFDRFNIIVNPAFLGDTWQNADCIIPEKSNL